MRRTRGLEKVESRRPAPRPEVGAQASASRRLEIGLRAGLKIPIIDPADSCRTALAFRPPCLFTIGVRASDWYCEKDQSLGETEEGELSRRIGFRYDWIRGVKMRVLEKAVPAKRRGPRRPQRREASIVVALIWELQGERYRGVRWPPRVVVFIHLPFGVRCTCRARESCLPRHVVIVTWVSMGHEDV